MNDEIKPKEVVAAGLSVSFGEARRKIQAGMFKRVDGRIVRKPKKGRD
jgi:hypothetical protein